MWVLLLLLLPGFLFFKKSSIPCDGLQTNKVSLEALSRRRQEIYNCRASFIIWLANKVTDFKRPIKCTVCGWQSKRERARPCFLASIREGVMKTKWLHRSHLLDFFLSLHYLQHTASLNWKVLPWGVNACQFLLRQTTVAIHGGEMGGGAANNPRCALGAGGFQGSLVGDIHLSLWR